MPNIIFNKFRQELVKGNIKLDTGDLYWVPVCNTSFAAGVEDANTLSGISGLVTHESYTNGIGTGTPATAQKILTTAPHNKIIFRDDTANLVYLQFGTVTWGTGGQGGNPLNTTQSDENGKIRGLLLAYMNTGATYDVNVAIPLVYMEGTVGANFPHIPNGSIWSVSLLTGNAITI